MTQNREIVSLRSHARTHAILLLGSFWASKVIGRPSSAGGLARFACYMTYSRPVGLVWVEPARCWWYCPHVFLVFSRRNYAMVIVWVEPAPCPWYCPYVFLVFYRTKYGMVIVWVEPARCWWYSPYVFPVFYRTKYCMVIVWVEPARCPWYCPHVFLVFCERF